MNDVGDKLARAGRVGRKAARKTARRVVHTIEKFTPRVRTSPSDTEEDQSVPDSVSERSEGSTKPPREPIDAEQQLKKVRRSSRSTLAEIKDLTAQRDRLRQERLSVQQRLGQQHGKSVMPRLKVEKTNGTPSFVIGQRMMQRVHRRGLDPLAGVDQVGAVFADSEQTAHFASSHAVPLARTDGASSNESDHDDAHQCLVHAFKGEVALVEVRGPRGVRHFDAQGNDVGDIRPAAEYDAQVARPEPFDDICAWAAALSDAIPRPYEQLVFGLGNHAGLHRIDVDPDRIPVLTPEWDERLGSMFDAAYSRVLLAPFHAGALAIRVPGGTFTYKEGA